MKMKYVSQIAAKLKQYKNIQTNRATSRVLDGSYRSVYKGRSMNFDELREYVVGDDLKDIDWKASARSQKLLVKQYIAEKKHNVMFVLDTNCDMLGDTEGLQEKRHVALLSAGVLSYLINHNGDYVGALMSTGQSLKMFPFKTGLANIEEILVNYHKYVIQENKSSLDDALEYLIRHFRKNMILILVTDLQGIQRVPDNVWKKVKIMNDVMVVTVSDTTLDSKTEKKSKGKTGVYSVEKQNYLPAFFTEDKKLVQLQENNRKRVYEEAMEKLKKYGINHVSISREEEIEQAMVAFLKRENK